MGDLIFTKEYIKKIFKNLLKTIWPEKLKQVEVTLASVNSFDFPQIILLENWN